MAGPTPEPHPARRRMPRRIGVLAVLAIAFGTVVAARAATSRHDAAVASSTSTTKATTAAPSSSSLPTTTVASTSTTVHHPARPKPRPMTPTQVVLPNDVEVLCGGWIVRLPPGRHLLVDDPAAGRAPSVTECAAARAFYDKVVAASSRYRDIQVALAAGFRAGGDPRSQIPQHYLQLNPTPAVADPNQPQGLVYRFDGPAHTATLLGVVFIERNGALPEPGGPVTVWHHHDVRRSVHMLHVWVFPGTIDPFALMYNNAVPQH